MYYIFFYLIKKNSDLIKTDKILIPNEMQLKIFAGVFVYNFILICHMYHIHNKHTIHLKRKRYKMKIRLTSLIKLCYTYIICCCCCRAPYTRLHACGYNTRCMHCKCIIYLYCRGINACKCIKIREPIFFGIRMKWEKSERY